jgi:hypothetical protein
LSGVDILSWITYTNHRYSQIAAENGMQPMLRKARRGTSRNVFLRFSSFSAAVFRRIFVCFSRYGNQAFKGRIINRLAIDGSVNGTNVNSSYA